MRPDWAPVAALAIAICLAIIIAFAPLTWAILVLLGGSVLAATLIRPHLGLLLLAPAVPFGSLRQVVVGGVNVGPTDLLVALVVAGWLARGIARRELRLKFLGLSLPLATLSAALLISSLRATAIPYSLKETIKWIEVLALYLVMANSADERWKPVLTAALLGSGVLAALQGIYQFLYRVGPEEFVLFGRFMRAYGTFEQPNPYAAYLGLTLPLALGLGLALMVRDDSPLPGYRTPALAFGTAVMTVALLMSWSRGAWLGILAALAIMLVLATVRSRRGLALVAAALVLALGALALGGLSIVPTSVLSRFSDVVPYMGVTDVRGAEITDANFAVLERLAHWQSALSMWRDNFWFGVGAGNYDAAYREYALPLWPHSLGHAHNYYLNIAAEAGLIGLVAYVVFLAAAFVSCLRALRGAIGQQWGLSLGVLGALVYLSVHSVFDNLHVHGMHLQLAMLLGLASRAQEPRGIGAQQSCPPTQENNRGAL